MWLLAGLIICGSAVSSTDITTPSPGRLEWGWRLSPTTIGHYYVKLPQKDGTGAEHRVSYTADSSGYHGAAALATAGTHHSHTATIAIGERAIKLLRQDPAHQRLTTNPNLTVVASSSTTPPFDDSQPFEIYLLQQQFTSPEPHNDNGVEIIPNSNTLRHISTLYTANELSTPTQYIVEHPPTPVVTATNEENEKTEKYVASTSERSKEINEHLSSLQNDYVKKEKSQVLNPVHIFKDHNCSEEIKIGNKSENILHNMQPTTKLYADLPLYRERNYNDFKPNYGAKINSSHNERQENERPKEKTITKGISKLVSSTQDLISNEDLLTINHAAERDNYFHHDEIIKPRPRNQNTEKSFRFENLNKPEESKNRITVSAKVDNIVDNENIRKASSDNEQLLQIGSNEYKFSSPIVVQDSTYNNFKTQIRNNIISTLVPYLEDGYTLSEVRNNYEPQSNHANLKEISDGDKDKTLNLATRPISQKYLAPITVGLRLINADDTAILNPVDDHEVSDTEIVTATVQVPENMKGTKPQQHREGKTTVEIQPSIPIEITKINDIIVHDDDEGRFSKNNHQQHSIFNKYAEALESSRKIQQNVNKNLYRYGSMIKFTHSNNNKSKKINSEVVKENLKPSASTQTEIKIQPDTQSNRKKEYIMPYESNFENKIIQPIIIEKEVPITKFVDRFVEQKVTHPQPVGIVKEVEKAVPVAVPIEKIIEKPVEVTKYIDRFRSYPVHVAHPVPVEVKIPYPIEQKIYVDRPVHVPYTVEKVIEKQIIQQVPTAVPVPIEVRVPVKQNIIYPVPVEKPVPVSVEIQKPVPIETVIEKEIPVPYPVEKPYPVPVETKVPVLYPVERKIPVPVEKIVEKPVTITKIIEKPIHIQVPVPQPIAVPVHVPQPYPVTVEKVVEKKVQVPVQIPYPVEKHVEKIVEKPITVIRYVEKPYPVEKRVPYPVEKIVEKRIPYPVQVPVEVKIPYPVDRIVEKPVHIPIGIPYTVEKVVEKPVNIATPYHTIQHKYPEQNGYQQNQNISPLYQQHHHILPYYLQYRNNEQNKNRNIQSTAWGNLYASNYQYINNTPEAEINDLKSSQSLKKYIGYVANSQKYGTPYMYYGPPPSNVVTEWNNHNPTGNYLLEFKLRRTDRTAKVGNLRIEYGGFKPPLIPSTEVDLDGVPIKCEEES